jgi:hypothetical protein
LILETYWKVRHYVYSAGLQDSVGTMVGKLGSAMALTPPPIPGDDAPLLIRPTDLPKVWAFNIEFVRDRIRASINDYLSLPSEHSAEFARRAEEGASAAELGLLRATLCREAIAGGEDSLAAESEYAVLAMDSWQEYRASEFEGRGIDGARIAAALEQLRAIDAEPASELIEDDTLALGAALDGTRALFPVSEFLSVLGPAVDLRRDADYAREALRALDACEVAHRWHALAEGSSLSLGRSSTGSSFGGRRQRQGSTSAAKPNAAASEVCEGRRGKIASSGVESR